MTISHFLQWTTTAIQ